MTIETFARAPGTSFRRGLVEISCVGSWTLAKGELLPRQCLPASRLSAPNALSRMRSVATIRAGGHVTARLLTLGAQPHPFAQLAAAVLQHPDELLLFLRAGDQLDDVAAVGRGAFAVAEHFAGLLHLAAQLGDLSIRSAPARAAPHAFRSCVYCPL